MTRSWSRWLSSVVLVAACWLGLAAAAQAETFTVTRLDDPAGAGTCATDRPSCSLRQAINASDAGDAVQLGGTAGTPAVYGLTQGTALLVDHSLSITGAGRAATKIDGTFNRIQGVPDRIMKVTAGPTQISGVTFTGGTDGKDEAFTSCSPCDTITANGGGALFNQAATVGLDGVGFEGNAGPVGGAIGNSGTLTLTDVEFRTNSAAFGAGLFSRGSGTVTATRVSFRDSGGTQGGGFYLRSGTMTLTNSTVTGNGASNAIGGGIVNQAGALTLTNVTLDANLRGGLETDQGASTSVQNTILGEGYTDGNNGACVKAGRSTSAGTSSQPVITAQAITTDLGNNLVGDTTCGPAFTPADPLLAPAGDNGGSTPTAALLHGSPAIDAGNDSACPQTDQRGIARAQQGTHCDIGAFEAVKLGAPTVTTGTATGISGFSATLSATVNLAGEAGALHFKWGTSPTALTESSDVTAAGVVGSPTQKSVLLYVPSPGTTYYYQAVADNATGSALGDVQQFTTGPAPPAVSEVRVTSVTDSTATIEFSVNPSGAPTHYVISYDTDDTGATETVPVDIGSGADPVPVKHVLTGLSPGTVYTFDVIATNSGGSQDYGIQEFATTERLTAQVGSAVTLNDTGNGPDCPTASIDWGDGTPADTTGTVTCSDDGHDGHDYELVASHTYTSAGRFHITIAYGPDRSGELWAEITAVDVPPPPPAATASATPAPVATPKATATPTPTPTYQQTVVVKPVDGVVLYKPKGSKIFVPLKTGQAVPLGSQIDVTKGKITLTSVPKPGGKPETATFYAGIFTVTQRGEYTELTLSGPLPTCKKKGKASAAAKKVKSRKLWGDGKGKFRTRGQYSAATIRGTRWLVEDSCAGTLTQVAVGVVQVEDTVRHKKKILRAGAKYLARPR